MKLVNKEFEYKTAKNWIETLMWGIRSLDDEKTIESLKENLKNLENDYENVKDIEEEIKKERGWE